MGRVALALGEHQEAQTLFEQSLSISEEFADRRGIAFAHQNLGDVALWDGDYKTAVAQYAQSLQLYREIADQLGVAFTFAKQGQAFCFQNEFNKARRNLVKSLETALTLGSVPVMMEGILGTAVLHLQQQNEDTASERLHFVKFSDESNQPQKERASHLMNNLINHSLNEPVPNTEKYAKQVLEKESAFVIE